MDNEASARKLAGPPARPLVRVVVYYLLLFGSAGALVSLAPETLGYLNAPLPSTVPFPGSIGGMAANSSLLGGAVSPWKAVLAAVVSLASACLLMLPVTWIYVQTRRKKGFEQSLVQTLIILPLVVAGVILLVQNSTALAFSLGGIVGAVSFRNTLRDTKDTIYIFLAIVIGVAAGVHALLVGATISVCFNIVAVSMWWTDFGRTAALLEGAPARERLERAKAMANRTQGFISMVDRELLRSMAPEQLEVLAERARARQLKADQRAGWVEEPKERRDRILRMEAAADPGEAQTLAEAMLSSSVKRYERALEGGASGGSSITYRVRLKKGTSGDDFLARFRSAVGDAVRKAEFVD